MRSLIHPGVVPAKHAARYRQIAEVLAEEGLHTAIDAFGLSRLAPSRRRRGVAVGALTTEEHVRAAIERLGVTFIKAGQALSTRTDIIPPSLARELRRLQDDVRSEPFESVLEVIERDIGGTLGEAFPVFDEQPFAAASIGQVHRAELPDGTEVAVKVQRPRVREQVEVDLDIALSQARWVDEHVDILGDLDVVELAGEFADAIRHELDYTREGRNAERLRHYFEGDDTVVFPRVFWSHTTSRVLTMEMLHGVRMNQIDALDSAGHDRVVLARRGVDCYLSQMFHYGFFHADPHPGNFLALEGDRVGFTDFGRCASISDATRERFTDLLWAAVNRDMELATDTLIALSHNVEVDEAALQREVTRLINKYYGRELGLINPADMFRETLGLVRDHNLAISSDFAVLLATLGVLEGVGIALDPRFDFAAAAQPFAERAVREQMRPDQLYDRTVRTFRRSARLLEALPSNLERIMRRLSRGEIRVGVSPREYQPFIDELHELANRLAFALVVSALVIGASLLLSVTGVPDWIRYVIAVGLLFALAISGWFFIAIIAAHYRGRRH